ncbi:MAG: hypothetical protein JNL74_07410, partial [Fibrobacteres bacterium]|nr:hypothetical protein [Fibrobacterota bacterium]
IKTATVAIGLAAAVFGANVTITTATVGQWSTAVAALQAGDTLTLAPGNYTNQATPSTDLIPKGLSNAGTAEKRIVIRAAAKNTVFIRARGEWISVSKPYYTFENLDIDGSGGVHAFHIKPGGAYCIIRNCHFSGIANSPIKLSTEVGKERQDYLVFENNECERSSGPIYSSVLNGFNLNGANFVVVRGNYIHEIAKSYAQPFYEHNDAYGGFMKAGAKYGIIENNIVKYINGMGLSLGGGTTAEQYFSEGTYPVEAMGCVMRNNVIVGFPNRNFGNRAFTINHGNGNLVYNNTFVNCINPAIFGKTWVLNPITGDSVMTGVGNIVMNNLSVNMFWADSAWATQFGYSSGGTLTDGIQFVWSTWSNFNPAFDGIIKARNAVLGNQRIDVANLNDLFFNADSNDFRLKPSGLHYVKAAAKVDSATVAGLAAPLKSVSGTKTSRDAGFIDSLISKGLIAQYFDKAGNVRPAVPAPGAYEAYDEQGRIVNVTTALENSNLSRSSVSINS